MVEMLYLDFFCSNNIPDIAPETGGTLSLYPYFAIEKTNHFTYN